MCYNIYHIYTNIFVIINVMVLDLSLICSQRTLIYCFEVVSKLLSKTLT